MKADLATCESTHGEIGTGVQAGTGIRFEKETKGDHTAFVAINTCVFYFLSLDAIRQKIVVPTDHRIQNTRIEYGIY